MSAMMTGPEVYRGIAIHTYDIPHTPFVWIHDETDGGGEAGTVAEARAQIDRHLSRLSSRSA